MTGVQTCALPSDQRTDLCGCTLVLLTEPPAASVGDVAASSPTAAAVVKKAAYLLFTVDRDRRVFSIRGWHVDPSLRRFSLSYLLVTLLVLLARRLGWGPVETAKIDKPLLSSVLLSLGFTPGGSGNRQAGFPVDILVPPSTVAPTARLCICATEPAAPDGQERIRSVFSHSYLRAQDMTLVPWADRDDWLARGWTLKRSCVNATFTCPTSSTATARSNGLDAAAKSGAPAAAAAAAAPPPGERHDQWPELPDVFAQVVKKWNLALTDFCATCFEETVLAAMSNLRTVFGARDE